FFEELWSVPVPTLVASDQSWVIGKAGGALRALGRLADAVEPMRSGAQVRVQFSDWQNAAAAYSNLSEFQLTLGRVQESLASARRSIEYADRSGDANWRFASRTTHADSLHQTGEFSEAGALFYEAENIQATSDSLHPILSSLWGYRYCDFLLSR